MISALLVPGGPPVGAYSFGFITRFVRCCAAVVLSFVAKSSSSIIHLSTPPTLQLRDCRTPSLLLFYSTHYKKRRHSASTRSRRNMYYVDQASFLHSDGSNPPALLSDIRTKEVNLSNS